MLFERTHTDAHTHTQTVRDESDLVHPSATSLLRSLIKDRDGFHFASIKASENKKPADNLPVKSQDAGFFFLLQRDFLTDPRRDGLI